MATNIYELAKELKSHKEDFVLWVKHWDNYKPNGKLTWNVIKFDQNNSSKIPKSKGLYIFTVSPDLENVPKFGFICYIGLAGHESKYNLKSRFRDYLREQKKGTRTLVNYFLNRYKDHLYFMYTIPHHRTNLAKLEKKLSDVYQPRYSTNDFSAEVRKARRVL